MTIISCGAIIGVKSDFGDNVMYKRILIALDLEGVNNVVGEPYKSLARDTAAWCDAIHQAALEVNAAAEALYSAGAELVALWDNHGGGSNVDPTEFDPRIKILSPDLTRPRMYFAKEGYDCICYFGYHTMEGTLGGVLAHTMSSVMVQYYKLNGKYIGEVDIDAYIAASYGMPSCFYAGGNLACMQAERAVEGIVTVVTKEELSRNSAVFRDNRELLPEIAERIVEAVSVEHPCRNLTYPAVIEKSFKRVEDAAEYLVRLKNCGLAAEHPTDDILGRDAHTVRTTIHRSADLITCI